MSVLMKLIWKIKPNHFLPYQNGMFGILYIVSELKMNVVHYERQTGTNSDFLMLNSHQEWKEGIFRISFHFI